MKDAVWRAAAAASCAAGIIALGFGTMLPMLTVKKLVLVQNTFSVLGGICELLADKTFGLGLLLLFFSVIFPLVKFLAMGAYAVVYPDTHGVISRWQGWLGKAAKFSMLDVFVVAQMLMIVKLGWLVQVQIHSGIYWFTAAVLLSIGTGIAIDRNILQRLSRAD